MQIFADADVDGEPTCVVEDDGSEDDSEECDVAAFGSREGLSAIVEANACRLSGIPLTEDDVQVLLEACEFTGYQVGKHRMVYQPDTLLEQMERKTQLGQIAGRFVVHVASQGMETLSLFIALNFKTPGQSLHPAQIDRQCIKPTVRLSGILSM